MAIAALVTAAPASAACWSASAPVSGGDWNTPGNWVGDAVPGPTETAVFTEQGGGCGVPQDVVVSGADAEVGLIRQANTEVIVDGTKLTISGISTLGTDLLGNVHVRNGGTLAIDVGRRRHRRRPDQARQSQRRQHRCSTGRCACSPG